MTYFITAYNNSRNMLIESESRTSDLGIADMIEKALKDRGFYVRRWSES